MTLVRSCVVKRPRQRHHEHLGPVSAIGGQVAMSAFEIVAREDFSDVTYMLEARRNISIAR
jgi:hypothetical protein